MSKSVDKGTVKELAGTLQNAALLPGVRVAAAESLLAASKSEQGCAILCSAGGLHAIFVTLKEAGAPADVLRVCCKVLCALYKFDGKLVAVVARLQGGIKALVDAVRDHMHGADMRLLQWLLCALSDVSHTAPNATAVVDTLGVPIALATLLAHLRVAQILLPCLYILINVTRLAAHVPAVVQEGGVPAVLAAVLAHVESALLVRTGLLLLRAISLDGSSALSFAVDGAFRILLAVMHTHGANGEQLDLLRLASNVLWRLYLARHPSMGALVEAWAQHPLQAGGAAGGPLDGVDDDEQPVDEGIGGENSSSADDDDGGGGASVSAGAGARRRAPLRAASVGAPDEAALAVVHAAHRAVADDDGVELTDGEDNDELDGGAAGSAGATAARAEALPRATMFRGGPALLDATSAEPEPTHHSTATMADSVALCLVRDAERLVHPTGAPGRQLVVSSTAGGCALPDYVPHAPLIVYDALSPPPPLAAGSHAPTAPGAPTLAPALSFSSAFESGNLRRAIRIRELEYDLVLACDVNTRGHTQWFFFRVDGMLPGFTYKFNVINMLKADSLFAHGMRPLLYSAAAARETGVGWRRCGHSICYYQNEYPVRAPGGGEPAASAPAARRKRGKDKADAATYFTLSFSVSLDAVAAQPPPPRCAHRAADGTGADADAAGNAARAAAADGVYICQCYPYTYTKLLARIDALQRLPSAASRLRVSSLCSSVGGHDVPLLTITDFAGASEAELRERKVVVVTARVHPGETNASWMMHGVIDELLADSAEARELRSALVFQVVPCLNPDGVILGNYRCSLSGDDLNRNWAEPSARKHPTIAHVKALLRGLAEEERLLFFCDFHGHSRKKSTFMYGVETPAGKGAPPGSHAGRLHERVFPLLLSRLSASFSFASCSFKVLRSKETTGRVVVARSFGLVPSYTLEASFCGPDGPGADGTPEAHYTIPDLQKLGKAFVHALRDFTHPSRTEYMGALAELEAMLPPKENAGGEVSDEDGEPTERDEAGARRSAPARRKSTPLGPTSATPAARGKKREEGKKRRASLKPK